MIGDPVRGSGYYLCLLIMNQNTVPHRKRQMDYVCHKNKCCQSYSQKQYNNTDFSPKKNKLGNPCSISTWKNRRKKLL